MQELSLLRSDFSPEEASPPWKVTFKKAMMRKTLGDDDDNHEGGLLKICSGYENESPPAKTGLKMTTRM